MPRNLSKTERRKLKRLRSRIEKHEYRLNRKIHDRIKLLSEDPDILKEIDSEIDSAPSTEAYIRQQGERLSQLTKRSKEPISG